MKTKSLRYSMAVLLVLALTLTLAAPASAKVGRYVEVQILSINDFHGALEEFRTDKDAEGNVIRTYGGAAYLATHVKMAEAENPNTLFLGAGDLIGASPLLSALFHDEPTVEALSMMGMDFSAVGNHEFDEGWQELLRIQYGGCNPVDGCLGGIPYYGAGFKYLSANVIREDTGKTLFPPFAIKNINGARVGIIGVGYENTPSIVVPSGVAGLQFKSELETINKYAKLLKRMRVKTIVVLLHDGGAQTGGINDCVNLTPSFADLIAQVDPEVDVIISGHTHNPYVCELSGKLVTGAWYNGRLYTDIDLKIDKATGNVVEKSALNLYNSRDVEPDAGILDLLAKYNAIAGPIADQPVGAITADITRATNAAGESTLGDVITDAQLWATAPAGFGEAVVAITNPGGLRADLLYAPDGVVTYGEAFAVQPFSNNLVTITLTGAQIDAVLEQQFAVSRILQVSNGFSYTYSASAPVGEKIDLASILINGVPVAADTGYRVTVNNFLAAGGDGFTEFLNGTDPLTGVIDLDAFVAYLKANSPVAPGAQDRIIMVP